MIIKNIIYPKYIHSRGTREFQLKSSVDLKLLLFSVLHVLSLFVQSIIFSSHAVAFILSTSYFSAEIFASFSYTKSQELISYTIVSNINETNVSLLCYCDVSPAERYLYKNERNISEIFVMIFFSRSFQ